LLSPVVLDNSHSMIRRRSLLLLQEACPATFDSQRGDDGGGGGGGGDTGREMQDIGPPPPTENNMMLHSRATPQEEEWIDPPEEDEESFQSSPNACNVEPLMEKESSSSSAHDCEHNSPQVLEEDFAAVLLFGQYHPTPPNQIMPLGLQHHQHPADEQPLVEYEQDSPQVLQEDCSAAASYGPDYTPPIQTHLDLEQRQHPIWKASTRGREQHHPQVMEGQRAKNGTEHVETIADCSPEVVNPTNQNLLDLQHPTEKETTRAFCESDTLRVLVEEPARQPLLYTETGVFYDVDRTPPFQTAIEKEAPHHSKSESSQELEKEPESIGDTAYSLEPKPSPPSQEKCPTVDSSMVPHSMTQQNESIESCLPLDLLHPRRGNEVLTQFSVEVNADDEDSTLQHDVAPQERLDSSQDCEQDLSIGECTVLQKQPESIPLVSIGNNDEAHMINQTAERKQSSTESTRFRMTHTSDFARPPTEMILNRSIEAGGELAISPRRLDYSLDDQRGDSFKGEIGTSKDDARGGVTFRFAGREEAIEAPPMTQLSAVSEVVDVIALEGHVITYEALTDLIVGGDIFEEISGDEPPFVQAGAAKASCLSSNAANGKAEESEVHTRADPPSHSAHWAKAALSGVRLQCSSEPMAKVESAADSYVSTLPPDSDCSTEEPDSFDLTPNDDSSLIKQATAKASRSTSASPARPLTHNLRRSTRKRQSLSLGNTTPMEALHNQPITIFTRSQQSRRSDARTGSRTPLTATTPLENAAAWMSPPLDMYSAPKTKNHSPKKRIRSGISPASSQKEEETQQRGSRKRRRDLKDHGPLFSDIGSVEVVGYFVPPASKKQKPLPYSKSSVLPDWVPSTGLQSASRQFAEDPWVITADKPLSNRHDIPEAILLPLRPEASNQSMTNQDSQLRLTYKRHSKDHSSRVLNK
jgi:hypothetical protein